MDFTNPNTLWIAYSLSNLVAVIFLLAIAPLGIYAAFPFSLIAATASILILRKGKLEYLWKRPSVIQQPI